MPAKILPVDVTMGRKFFQTVVTETIYLDEFREARVFLGLTRDIEYVSGLLYHSLLFATDDQFAVWGGGPLKDPDLGPIARRIIDGNIEVKSAQDVADRLLLRLGFFEKEIWRPEILCLERNGGALYSQAARIHEPPLRKQLQSMGQNFLPWTEVFHAMKQRRSLFI